MHTFTALGALGLIASSIARFISESNTLLALALVSAILTLIGTVSTRVELVRRIQETTDGASTGC
jgi:H+/gluconate symporter-like permease